MNQSMNSFRTVTKTKWLKKMNNKTVKQFGRTPIKP